MNSARDGQLSCKTLCGMDVSELWQFCDQISKVLVKMEEQAKWLEQDHVGPPGPETWL